MNEDTRKALERIVAKKGRGCGVRYSGYPESFTCLDMVALASDPDTRFGDDYRARILAGDHLCVYCIARQALAATPAPTDTGEREVATIREALTTHWTQEKQDAALDALSRLAAASSDTPEGRAGGSVVGLRDALRETGQDAAFLLSVILSGESLTFDEKEAVTDRTRKALALASASTGENP